MTELGISSYGVSVTTMEEVFIKAGEEGDSLIAGTNNQTLRDQEGSGSSSSFNNYGTVEPEVAFKSKKGIRGGNGSYDLIKDEVHVSVVSCWRRLQASCRALSTAAVPPCLCSCKRLTWNI